MSICSQVFISVTLRFHKQSDCDSCNYMDASIGNQSKHIDQCCYLGADLVSICRFRETDSQSLSQPISMHHQFHSIQSINNYPILKKVVIIGDECSDFNKRAEREVPYIREKHSFSVLWKYLSTDF